MKLGILSDTHGRAAIAREAVQKLTAAGATAFVHCGDVGDDQGGEAVLDALAGLDACFVFGNNDWHHDDLRRYAEAIGVVCLDAAGTIEKGGRRIAVTHGDDARLVARLTTPQNAADYLLTGHSHVRHDRRVGAVRWINPGALYRATVKSVAVLDLATDALEWIEWPNAAAGRGR